MTRRQKFIRMIPFFILCAVMLYTWFQFLFGGYISSWYHVAALQLVLLNAVVYGIRFKVGLLMTGVVLLLGLSKAVCFFTGMDTFGIGIGGHLSPEIQARALLLLLIYCFLNFGLLIEWYVDWEQTRKERARNDQ